ncbi:hypothetical protein [Novosphingobium album (ex Hu et al. 2023)]|uniref:Sulfotransferase family protein n=1 Tax=Novosphingobium album (ex Hu et al. 2023) TaxID=2930093 RepID=A0ABT0B2S0_9SPHN|nr:hypothetical protein [Novosphingobium album (ex Hu et al. 2023)]MCJ2179352.1 hypothetical protein [Novosphingobium album (ex Hu et al. 2023)]
MTPFQHNLLPGILLACMPKSGSSSLSRMLGNLAGVRVASLVPGWDIREQEIDFKILEHQLLQNANQTFVAQMHVVCSSTTRGFLTEGALSPLIQTRNFPDAIVSAADHHLVAGHPSERVLLPEDFLNWDDDRRYDYMIAFKLPWHLKFFKSWILYEGFRNRWVRYEDFALDAQATLRSAVRALGLNENDPYIATVAQAPEAGERVRFNKGVSGRGRQNLTRKQLTQIEDMVALFELPSEYLGYVLEGEVEGLALPA